MNPKTLLSTLLCMAMLCGTVLTCAFNVSADQPAPSRSFKIILEDGNKILYVTPDGQENETQLKSGLYHNTEPPENIYFFGDEVWQYYIKWYVHESNFFSKIENKKKTTSETQCSIPMLLQVSHVAACSLSKMVSKMSPSLILVSPFGTK